MAYHEDDKVRHTTGRPVHRSGSRSSRLRCGPLGDRSTRNIAGAMGAVRAFCAEPVRGAGQEVASQAERGGSNEFHSRLAERQGRPS
jgi:hypothetical protein